MKIFILFVLLHGGIEPDFSRVYNSGPREAENIALSSLDISNKAEEGRLALPEDYSTLSNRLRMVMILP